MSKKMPFRLLGRLKPDAELVKRINKEGLALSDFWAQAAPPQKLVTMIERNKLLTTESRGMLYANNAGVGMHVDQEISVIWFLTGLNDNTEYGKSHELIVDGEFIQLEDGMVIWVDTTKYHAVVAGNHNLWGCLSINVEPVDLKAE